MNNAYRNNIILNANAFQSAQFLQYPKGTTHISSHIENGNSGFDRSAFFGLQMFIKEFLCHPISRADVDEAEAIILSLGLPFNRGDWQYIVNHKGGYLPVTIQAVEEGAIIPRQNVLLQIVNTDPATPWLTHYLETALLRAVSYPSAMATATWHGRQIIRQYMEATCDNLDGLDDKIHDYGAGAASSEEAAAIGGAAHLANFQSSDNLNGIMAAKRYYRATTTGLTFPAVEANTIATWGQNKLGAFDNTLERFFGPGKTVTMACELQYDWDKKIQYAAINRQGILLIRPRQGDPVTSTTDTIEELIQLFGCSVNSRNYRELPPYIQVLQADGIDLPTLEAILANMKQRNQSANNIMFGLCGEWLQTVHQHRQSFIAQTSAAKVEGLWRDVAHTGSAKSGRLALIKNPQGQYQTIREQDLLQKDNLLKTVYKNGELLVDYHFDDIRQRLKQA